MSLLEMRSLGGYLAFDEAQCRTAGKSLSARYQNAPPFPHVVIDDFVDADILREAVSAYPTPERTTFFDRDQERLKYQYHPSEIVSPPVRSLFAELNGQAFSGFLEELTGYPWFGVGPVFCRRRSSRNLPWRPSRNSCRLQHPRNYEARAAAQPFDLP